MSKADPAQTMLNNIPVKTGKTLKQWFAVLKKAKLEKHGEMMKLLKGEHGITHGFANLIVHKYRETDTTSIKAAKTSKATTSMDDPIAAQYSGAKADLKPIYDKLLKVVQGFGDDVEVSPKKAYVSLRRSKQFALVQPSTKTRVDVGIKLKGVEPTARLETSGSFNAMVTHRVRISDIKEVNAELKKWLKQAYDAA